MKKPFLFFLALVMSSWGFAQSTSPEVIGSAGDHYSNGTTQMSWTLGEISTETYSDANNQLTQGFHQVTLMVTAIDDQLESLAVQVFPNPVADQLNISLEESTQAHRFRLLDASGKQLQVRESFFLNAEIDFSNYAKGTYFLHISDVNGTSVKTFKILKIK